MTDNVVNLPTSDAMVEAIARTCHEANRGYCVTLGDYSHLPWATTAEDLKASVRDGVRFLLRNPFAGPEESHKRWMERKLRDGWIYGHTKLTRAKVHPNLVAWDKLPAHERVKDSLFLGIVNAFRYYEVPGPGACRRHAAMTAQTSFACCLPKGHPGPCAPTQEIDPLEIIRPEPEKAA